MMNHIKLYEEFSEETKKSLDVLKGFGIDFEGYSLYFVEAKGEETTRDFDGDEDEWNDWNDPEEIHILQAVICKNHKEFYDQLYYTYENSYTYLEPKDYEDFVDYNGIDVDGEKEDSIIKSMEGETIASLFAMSDQDYECELKMGKILGPFDTNATEPMAKEYPFGPDSKISKYAAPYMNLPEVKALLASVSK